MSKNQFHAASRLTILSGDKEIISAKICFTSNAIALLSNYAATGAAIHLDDWEGYKELRSGSFYYIVTGIKKAAISA
ncbi:hypothetical protein LQ567_16295 [Niabella pedocola]|uniref:Uncharacterized protein n=1 Tax=Niabella pedocola TaxID=1752077 RepID=A0ABS8PWT7_9BACT|nr:MULTISPECIES: hypothetical protein [Niabella]MBZ4189349.1 hypothetical protein [Niabella beijingensis]MCD2424341.1 hypothetical protein [Niabella pedocola]